MKLLFKIAGWLLLAAVSASSVMAHQIEQATAVSQRPAGCHERGGTVPAPVSYQCCQAGHDFAVVQAPSVSQPDWQSLSGVEVPTAPTVAMESSKFVAFLELSGGPPGIAPLRI